MSQLPTNGIEFPSFTKTWHSEPYPYIDPLRPQLSAKGKIVVITGGGTGIGNSVGVAFAKARAKHIVILGRRLEKLEAGQASIRTVTSDGTTVSSRQVDLSNKEQTVAVFGSIRSELGPIDVLVLNAGTYGDAGRMAEISANGLMQTLEANVVTVLNTFQAFLPHAAPKAVLIHSSTLMAHIAPMPGSGVYPITKAAALKLMDYIAAENPELRVISTQPAWTPTDLNNHDKNATDSIELPGCFFVWLASPEAEFLNGKFVWSNWDVEELAARAEEIRSSRLLTWHLDGVAM